MSYPIAGMVRDYRPAGLSAGITPSSLTVWRSSWAPGGVPVHGSSQPSDVYLRAAELIRYRRLRCRAGRCGRGTRPCSHRGHEEGGHANGLRAVGYTPRDVDALVEGVLPQHRVTKLSPRRRPPQISGSCPGFDDHLVATPDAEPAATARPPGYSSAAALAPRTGVS